MNEAAAARLTARHAALERALREGDPRAIARTAARLRIPGARIHARDLAEAHAARHLIGIAIVAARHAHVRRPRPLAARDADSAPRPAEPAARARTAIAAALVTALVLVGLFARTSPDQGGGERAAGSASEVAAVGVSALLRGRSAALPPIVAVSAEPTPTAPTSAPAPTPTATRAPGGQSGGAGTGPGGSGGAGGGTAPGGGGGTGPGAATPPTSRTPLPGFARISVIVLDARTLLPLPDACVLFGAATTCEAWKTHTDQRGRWSDDIPVSTARVFWDLYFVRSGYASVVYRVTLESQRIVEVEVRLNRVP